MKEAEESVVIPAFGVIVRLIERIIKCLPEVKNKKKIKKKKKRLGAGAYRIVG